MAKILISHGVPSRALKNVPWLASHHLVMPPEGKVFSREEMEKHMADADLLLACGVTDAELLSHAEKLKLIISYGAGYNNIDVGYAKAHGIRVCNIPDSVTEGTAELAFALLLSLSRRVTQTDRLLRELPSEEVFGMGKRMGTSLRGHTLGVVGMGRIGQRVAAFARFFGMKVVYSAHQPKPECDALGDRFLSLEDLAAECDIMTLHCPLTEETRGLIDEAILGRMKPGALLINTARGAVVEEAALLKALQSGKLGGAALDVFPNEPTISPELKTLPHVILTSHIGSNTYETRDEMILAAMDTMDKFLNGEPLKNVIV